MRKIFVSALAIGVVAVAGATVSVEARADSAPITLGAAELDAVKGGQFLSIRRSFNNTISRSGNSTATVSGSGDYNSATSESNFNVEQGTGIFISFGIPDRV
jgi:hypothetical protein